MKKEYLIITFLFLQINLAKSQRIKEITSFTCKPSYMGTLWYIVNAEVKDDYDSTFIISDSIMAVDPAIKTILPFSYRISNDTFIGLTCYNKFGLEKCRTDSILLYTPIKYFSDSTNPELKDTLRLLQYSTILQNADEPIIYNQLFNNDILRFMSISKDSVIIYRVIKNDSYTTVIKKVMLIRNEEIKIIENISIVTKSNTFDNLLKYLKRGKYWQMDSVIRIEIPDILIESYINRKYYFINKNRTEIEMNNKKNLECFKILSRL